jgi:hypothetical protein
MRRLAVIAITGAVLAVAPATAQAASSYCSPTGDYCHGAVKRNGVLRLQLDTFSFRGRVTACVERPSGRESCKRFLLRPRKNGILGFSARWSAHFPHGGNGVYRVRFRLGEATLGPRVTFRIGRR